MVIIDSKSGQLANRIFSFAFFIANAIEHNHTLYNPTFDEYEKYFPRVLENRFLNYSIKTRLSENEMIDKFLKQNLERLRYRLPKIDKKKRWIETLNISDCDKNEKKYDLNSQEFLEKTNKILFVQGWNFRDYENFDKHADKLRTIFKPKQEHLDNIAELMQKNRQDVDTLIGVHIRRGDYKDFFGGKYFFEWTEYADFLVQIVEEVKKENPNQKVRFMLCSNDKIQTTSFEERNLDICFSTNHFLEDMYALAACDYILGVPSSYSMWASFYGKTPLRILDKKGIQISLQEFSPIKTIDHFENGKVFKHELE
ncbi:alpha-1,2-fucosyltransferase [Bernardetia sp.]|uniref:alpha-1,2-fucosyltransferase n=1 Tax=Bernardetia sp. TaxID=1937974 RepID=UPI0025BBA0B0|nr:alpha-1,2-fucosyltransferase [Bernardetia sp.]